MNSSDFVDDDENEDMNLFDANLLSYGYLLCQSVNNNQFERRKVVANPLKNSATSSDGINGISTFTCPFQDCGRQYRYNYNLKQHMNLKH
jgi:hypothetical protein